MESWAKGTVTPLASAFPVEEAKKAAQQLQESLETSRQELHKLDEFVQDNRKLMKLVQKLPDEMSHNIMVPFGKAAFFPGRMIHTNEFLVLLGEGYHAECTAKQTLEVLRRRSKVLDSKIEGIKAVMEDLQTEAMFFTSTAAEADAGVMEIREDYVEKPSLKEKPDLGHHSSSAKLEASTPATATDVNDDPSTEDKEFDRIMSRLSELEQAEAEENGSSSDDGEEPSSEFGRMNDHEHDDSEDDKVESQTQISLGTSTGKQMSLASMELPMSKGSFASPRDQATIRSPADILKFEEWKTKSVDKDVDRISQSQKKVSFQLDPVESTCIKGLKAEKEIGNILSSQDNNERFFPSNTQASKDPKVEHEDKRQTDARKAFTGLVVEHGVTEVSDNVKGSNTSQVSESKPSRPVSRFKMQKANRLCPESLHFWQPVQLYDLPLSAIAGVCH
ncbi:uncharacterized protein LOC131069691 isoform X1 [Cryptomeria japonica]|uniref:uncharacterized protein LOC131069691 isoform X1 n=2 Tax=Cryptomeria japonica TaxID=3369 RepID=UPI0027DA7DC3|nr:uncharacterized protein LOC131069691 isoform X1 [Cryptomeria japonica]XP_057861192.2 uncharacterized protein LOC131069691 isoform X1 [Cryptomeria japonica]